VDEDEERPAADTSIADPVAVQCDLAVLHRVSEHLSTILPEHGTTWRGRGRPRRNLCAGLAAPVEAEAEIFEGLADVPARVRALVRALGKSYAFWEPWLRWGVAEVAFGPELKGILERWRSGREALACEAFARGFGGRPPRALLDIAAALLDFPAWKSLTRSSDSKRTEAVLADALITLYRSYRSPRKGESRP
jgi:hypothetical protein